MKTSTRFAAFAGGATLLFYLYNVYAAQGTVIDGSTGKPMAGVQIVAAWYGSVAMPVQPNTRCYHAEATVTDERGRFSLSTFTGNVNPLMLDRARNVWAIAPGYTISDRSDYGDLAFVLVPATGTKSEQFKALPYPSALGCPVNSAILMPYWKVLHAEAARLASNRKEREEASGILFGIERTELGVDEARRRLDQRMREEILENGF